MSAPIDKPVTNPSLAMIIASLPPVLRLNRNVAYNPPSRSSALIIFPTGFFISCCDRRRIFDTSAMSIDPASNTKAPRLVLPISPVPIGTILPEISLRSSEHSIDDASMYKVSIIPFRFR
jgi:hypothetical protein